MLTLPPTDVPVAHAPRPTEGARTFLVASRDHPRREAIERLIAAVYRTRYGARLRAWAPTLVAIAVDGRVVAAAGFRRATETLYLERYLGDPVEAAIRSATGAIVDRAAIAEIGHFASARHGEGRRLMTLLARHLHASGVRWGATTATRELQALYERLDLRAWRLADAARSAAGNGAADWGRYYDHAPAVIAGPIERNLERLERCPR